VPDGQNEELRGRLKAAADEIRDVVLHAGSQLGNLLQPLDAFMGHIDEVDGEAKGRTGF
jgi:hypothetical protein